jgi:PAS domain S-box-containing protein
MTRLHAESSSALQERCATADSGTPHELDSVKPLSDKERQLSLVTDAAPVMISYVNADRCFEFVNSRYAQWYGLDRDAIVGKSVEEVIGRESYGRIRGYIDTVLRGIPVTYERQTAGRLGDRFIRADLMPDLDDHGHVRGYVAATVDITDQKQAEQSVRDSELLYRTLIEVSPQIVWMTDAQGRPVYFNQHWYDYTGVTSDRAAEAVHPEDAPRLSKAWQELVAAGRPLDMELRLRRG